MLSSYNQHYICLRVGWWGQDPSCLKALKKKEKKKVFWKNKSQALSAYSGTTAFVNIILRMSQSVCTSSSTVL